MTAPTTAQLCDACLRNAVPLRLAPPGIRGLTTGMSVFGPARPVRHYGSVDVFLEAIDRAAPGEVLVIDNGGRLDEGCIGDLTVLEAKAAGLAGVVVWGVHRDDRELREIGWPVFSYGTWAGGPVRLDARDEEALRDARFGDWIVTQGDRVYADGDGVLFVDSTVHDAVARSAAEIAAVEREQAALVAGGRTLRHQLDLKAFLRRREADPSYSFREHLRSIGGAIEE